MKKATLIAIICCALPIAGVLLFSLFGGWRADRVTAPDRTSPRSLSVGTAVGNLAPDFKLTEVLLTIADGETITKDNLMGKPAIIWFTTSYCVPCQIGAADVAQLDDDLGGDKFNVVMVFIDPRETKLDLQLWKARFANDDWIVAFGNDTLVSDYKIRYLDTQYLLDKNGVIKNVANSNVGYERYKELIQPLLQ